MTDADWDLIDAHLDQLNDAIRRRDDADRRFCESIARVASLSPCNQPTPRGRRRLAEYIAGMEADGLSDDALWLSVDYRFLLERHIHDKALAWIESR